MILPTLILYSKLEKYECLWRIDLGLYVELKVNMILNIILRKFGKLSRNY